ncbi:MULTISPECIES: glutamate synthase large subunit [Veillonella]|uniref:glutamate synthase large subunit n=1 Tax=Veillonella TaxID=29465 RepID=UPI00044E0122|nr:MULTISPECIES: glutamate synthase large subunit [Veillonella]EUB25296.1 glutamate synthase [NADPH], large subunit [Veillonella sp. ICM51a]MBS7012651.1 glutamate synthase large subunit [Veillonella sp.]MDU3513608.1 glutamate synthase large subunit [Veillonella sp.]MDU3603841.1 glutamate synthase large subunit [Veillonella sp.]MDU4409526.1 glutamate synthase large subunit [Veillonella sp.]
MEMNGSVIDQQRLDQARLEANGMYSSQFEKDACGMGFVVNIKGKKSHDIIDDGLRILERLEHRGGAGADKDTGDGAGILVQIPHEFFKRECEVLGISLPAAGEYGVGMIFAHKYESLRNEQKRIFEEVVREEGQVVLGWREVPVDGTKVGKEAAAIRPWMIQILIGKGPDVTNNAEFERKLYVIRKLAEKRIIPLSKELSSDFYIASLSSKTIVYKGMLTPGQLRDFYLDLSDLDFTSALAMVHSRFSTNTFPSWARAHPNRFLVHNGEINTIRGNVNWINAREGKAESPLFPDIKKVFPVVDDSGSDSAMFDNTLEFLHMTGRSLPHAIMMMIPEPWERNKLMSQEKHDFYEFNSFMMEPWDGPAAMGFTDGTVIGGVLDRNGLRPARYYVTTDDRVIMASEVGVVNENAENIRAKGRLEPGKMLLIDTAEQRIISDDEIKQRIATELPYDEWIKEHVIHLSEITQADESDVPAVEDLFRQQQAFGYTQEDLVRMIVPMAKDGKDPVGAMGADAPLAILSEKPQLLYNYFKQMFAQVTNPPIDSIREEMVTSTRVMLGNSGNLTDPNKTGTYALSMRTPILTNQELASIKALACRRMKSVTLPILFDPSKGVDGMREALKELCEKAEEAARTDQNVLILSDRGVDANHAPIPALLAVAAVHNHLIRKVLRTEIGLILESGEPREVHHFCTLIGYGVTAINPYLAFETVKDLHARKRLGDITLEKAEQNYIKAAVGGIMKVMSKMGISTVRSYHGAQIFEALGLNSDFIKKYFVNTPTRIGGIGLYGVTTEALARFDRAFKKDESVLEPGGWYGPVKDGEEHLFNPKTIDLLQESLINGDYAKYKEYSKAIRNDYHVTLRSLMELNYPVGGGIPIEEVEPEESIVKRFKAGAMSYGAISKEAHETIAIAMNRLGSTSNSGEGGEDSARFKPLPNGDSMNSEVKQIASGRFGVTANYLIHAKELQIKCAQGAKPGEGGQLPGKKVYPEIGKARHSTPGVELVSPPPHHDIYSIEDLAELIYDLKCVNKDARISVKLTSEAGVGTIAAGVAKAKADNILISGYDGGTGAAGRTSVKHAGVPWELGLSETHQTLMLNRLRDRVQLEVDSKLMTGFDVAVAAMLGAELFGFGTLPLVAVGCKMARVCNLNTCPYGVATQDEKLRARFNGKPEYVENLMIFIARELREIMARLGIRSVAELVGRIDLVRQKSQDDNFKLSRVDLKRILFHPYIDASVGHMHTIDQDHELERTLDMSKLLRMCRPAIEDQKPIRAKLAINNINRVVGTLVGSEVTRRYGESGLPDNTIKLNFEGSAGQSFGAFIPKGMTLELEGDANDYLGKGLSGGTIVVYPPKKSIFEADENILIGNVAFYGATSGKSYINGVAGERFAVRNSGITAVVEGVGDHGCEYMTGGEVLVLGKIGRNFAAGMSGGYAYILDCDERYVNTGLVELRPANNDDLKRIKELVEQHVLHTNSTKGRHILENWNNFANRFTKVVPVAYEEMHAAIERFKEQGLSLEEAQLAAFKEKYAK